MLEQKCLLLEASALDQGGGEKLPWFPRLGRGEPGIQELGIALGMGGGKAKKSLLGESYTAKRCRAPAGREAGMVQLWH